MGMRYNKLNLAVFFCSLGTVCAGPAMGQNANDRSGPGNPVRPSTDTGDQPTTNSKPGPAIGVDNRPDANDPANPATADDDQAVELFTNGTDDGAANDPTQKVQVGTYGQIDLHVKDLPLTKVLQLLSIQSQRNIIASRNVSGAVSADLYGVSFRQALDSILHTNGFDYQEKGNFIYVYTADEMKQIREQERQAVTRIVHLNYLSAKDASALLSPMLTPGFGSIAVPEEASAGFQPTISDGGANSFAAPDMLIIRDYADNIDQIQKVVKELDKRPRQVLIKATVLQSQLTENNAFGVDFALFSDLNVENFTNPLSAVGDMITGEGAGGAKLDSGQAITSSVADDTINQSSVKVGFLGSDAAVFVRALDSVADTTVLATPKLLVLNRQKAHLHVGGQLGYISTTQTDTSQTQTVEFLDVGTELSVRPFIGDDDFIRMELQPSVSDGSTSTVSGLVIPNKTTSEMTTNVLVRNAQTVVLGGLFKEDTGTTRSQIPGLGDIPIVGNLGKAQDDNVTRNEVIFLIKPTIMKDQVLTKVGDRAIDSVNAAQIGSRRGLLPWSTTKLTSAHMREALQALQNGDKKKALWNVNLALAIDPAMPQALKLKARLTGQSLYLYDHSLFNDMVNSMIDQTGDATPREDDDDNLQTGAATDPDTNATTLDGGAKARQMTDTTEGQDGDRAADAPVAEVTETTPQAAPVTPADDPSDSALAAPPAKAGAEAPTAKAPDDTLIDQAVRRYANEHAGAVEDAAAPRTKAPQGAVGEAGPVAAADAAPTLSDDSEAMDKAIAAMNQAAQVNVLDFVGNMLASLPNAQDLPAADDPADTDNVTAEAEADNTPASQPARADATPDRSQGQDASSSQGTFTGVYPEPGR